IDLLRCGPSYDHRTMPEDRIWFAGERAVIAARVAVQGAATRGRGYAPSCARAGHRTGIVVGLEIRGQVIRSEIRPVAVGVVLRQVVYEVGVEICGGAADVVGRRLGRVADANLQIDADVLSQDAVCRGEKKVDV